MVLRTAYEKLGLGAIAQEAVGIGATLDRDRRAQRDNPRYAFVRTSGAQSGGGAEGESAEDDRQMKLRVQPVDRGSYIIDLALPLIVFTFAHPGATEIESQHRKAELMQSLHRMIDNLVVHRAAI